MGYPNNAVTKGENHILFQPKNTLEPFIGNEIWDRIIPQEYFRNYFLYLQWKIKLIRLLILFTIIGTILTHKCIVYVCMGTAV